MQSGHTLCCASFGAHPLATLSHALNTHVNNCQTQKRTTCVWADRSCRKKTESVCLLTGCAPCDTGLQCGAVLHTADLPARERVYRHKVGVWRRRMWCLHRHVFLLGPGWAICSVCCIPLSYAACIPTSVDPSVCMCGIYVCACEPIPVLAVLSKSVCPRVCHWNG